MNIGELFVRISADASGVKKGTDQASAHFRQFWGTTSQMTTATSAAMKGATLNVNRLGGAFLSLASQATGVNPAVARLTNVLGAFALTGPWMVGVLAGITAVSVGWRLWTSDAREAAEATEKLTDAMLRAADARSLGATGGQKAVQEAALADKARLQAERAVLRRAVMPTGVGTEGEQIASIMAQRRLEQIEVELGQAARAYIEAGTQVAEVLSKQAAETAALAEAARRAAEAMREATQKVLDQRLRWAGEGVNIGGAARGHEGLGGPITLPGVTGSAARSMTGAGGVGAGPAGMFSGALDMAKNALTSFGPAALVVGAAFEVLKGIMVPLQPIMEVFKGVFQSIGELLGSLIAPVLRVVAKGFSYVLQAIGWFVEGLGKFIDAIVPDWISKVGKGLAEQGQSMQDNAVAMRKAMSGATDGLIETVERITESLRNVPTGFKVALARFNATNPGGGGSGGGTTAPGSGANPIEHFTITGPVTIVAPDPETFARKARQLARRGGGTPLVLAYE